MEKAANAESVVRKAIEASASLAKRSVSVFTQGSYRNRTNVREDSDVDVCVLCSDTLFPSYVLAPGYVDTELKDATYQYADYRKDVERALVAYFGPGGVTRGKKAFDVHANTYRIDADVVACFEYRQYQRNADNSITREPGTGFLPDAGPLIWNWPEQNYANGVSKNDTAGRFYKPAVRILKRLKNDMASAGHTSGEAAPSFLLESLLYNVSADAFQEPTWLATLKRLLGELHGTLSAKQQADDMLEVNRLKYLFRDTQPWTRQGAQAFVLDAWNYIHTI